MNRKVSLSVEQILSPKRKGGCRLACCRLDVMTWPSTKKKYAKFILAALLLIAGVGVCVFILPGKADFARLRGGKNFNIILITLDTTRADRLGCYGFKNIETPTIDRFASLGIKFERCFSTTPLTLPAHTSIMTGTLPPFHGVPRPPRPFWS